MFPTFAYSGSLLNVSLTNALSGQGLANQSITIFQQQTDGTFKGFRSATTDSQGKVSLDLPGLGSTTQYQLRTTPYGTGNVFSDVLSSTGSLTFKVGHVETQLIKGANGQPLTNHRVSLREVLSNGKTKGISSGTTDAQGIARFDPDLTQGKKYLFIAVNPFDGKTQYSKTFSQKGKIPFTIGNKPLNVSLINALTGQGLANQAIMVMQQHADGNFKAFRSVTTNAQGKVSLDLPGLGSTTQYQLRTTPYGTGHVFSDVLSSTGALSFKVGHVETQLIKGANNQPLANHRVSLREVLSNGKTKGISSGTTNAQGIARFDPDLTLGKKYLFIAVNPFDGKSQYSKTFSQKGKIPFTIGNKPLNVSLTNALSGQGLANQSITVFQQQADGTFKGFRSATTDSQGKVSLDLPGLGSTTQYQLRTTPYGTGHVFSDVLSNTGSLSFKVGHIETQLIKGANGQPLTKHKVSLREVLSNGNTKGISSGTTDAQGIARFDPDLTLGKKYLFIAVNPFDGKSQYSKTFSQKGKIPFTIGNKPLNVSLINALSGQGLANQSITIFQQQADGTFKGFRSATTNSQGKVSLDLPGLGSTTQYQLRTTPYTTGHAFSQPISNTGTFNFKVGKVKIRLTNAESKAVIPNHKLFLYEKTSDGKLHWQRSGNTNDQGIAYFDPDSLDSGKIYLIVAKNVFGTDQTFYSQWINTTGFVEFSVSPDQDSTADLTPPIVNILSPHENSPVSDKGFLIKARVDEKNIVKRVQITVIDPIKGETNYDAELIKGQWVYFVNPQQITVNNEILVKIAAFDDSENIGESSRKFRVIQDFEKPRLIIDSHQNRDQVSEKGFILTGNVSDNTAIKELIATVIDPKLGTVVENSSVQISDSGRWAIPVNQISRGNTISVTLNAIDFSGNKTIEQLSLDVTVDAFKATQLLNRITFGATPELLEELKFLGSDAFIQQQLNPHSIDNSEFDQWLNETGVPDSKIGLQAYQLAHAIYSKKQLLEVMTWFWENHFNTDINKTGTQREIPENEKFRKHALGNFRDILEVSSNSSAMMTFLDNRHSLKEEPNENYARELLELHTMGVEGGYLPKDIQELARAFTGWRVQNLDFYFHSNSHDFGDKQVLGQAIPPGLGKEDGEIVLDVLSAHPSTAHFICKKLLQIFVSDSPEALAIENCSIDFLDNSEQNNQIALVLEGIFNSDYFSAGINFNNKIKTPLEFVASFNRNLNVKTSLTSSVKALAAMDMNLFENPSPTGFPETGKSWINSNRYLQYLQFVSTSVFNKPYKSNNYLEDPANFFKSYGYETSEGIVGFLFYLTFSNDYTKLEWETAIRTLTENDTKIFDINAEDANERIRNLLATALNFPTYQLQ